LPPGPRECVSAQTAFSLHDPPHKAPRHGGPAISRAQCVVAGRHDPSRPFATTTTESWRLRVPRPRSQSAQFSSLAANSWPGGSLSGPSAVRLSLEKKRFQRARGKLSADRIGASRVSFPLYGPSEHGAHRVVHGHAWGSGLPRRRPEVRT